MTTHRRLYRFIQTILVCCALVVISAPTFAQDAYLGEIRMFAGNYPPRGWMFCNGQMIAIRQNAALFSLIYNQFGGDGRNTFALPNLNNIPVIGAGKGTGLTPNTQGTLVGPKSSSAEFAAFPKEYKAADTLFRFDLQEVATATHMIDLQPPMVAGIKYIIAVRGIYPCRP